MRARVDEVSLTEDGHLYLSVSFWLTKVGMDSGREPVIVNDFIIAVPPPEMEVPVLDENGEPTGETQAISIDRRVYVRQAIISFMRDAIGSGWRGDLTDQRIRRSLNDHNGLLALFADFRDSLVDA